LYRGAACQTRIKTSWARSLAWVRLYEAKNQIQYAALVPLHQELKGILVPLGGFRHQFFVGNEWVNHFG